MVPHLANAVTMGSDIGIDDIYADDDDRFYAVFPDARPSPRQAQVEAEHARMFPPDPVYQYVDPATSWAFYPPTMSNYHPCSPTVASFAAAASPIARSESEYCGASPPSATSVTANASFASHSPESSGADDTPPPSASTSSEPDPLTPDMLLSPPLPGERPAKRRISHYPASPPRSSLLPVLPPGSLAHVPSTSLLSDVHPPASAAPPTKKLKSSAPRRSSGPGAGATDGTKKPPLACLFCRGRKIACGPPVGGAAQAGCNQCQRRALKCEYPLESRRGMRKKKPTATPPPGEESAAEGKDKDGGGEADVQADKDVTGEGEEDAVKAEELDLEGDIAVPVDVSTPIHRTSASLPVLTVNVQLEKTRDPRRPPPLATSSAPPSAH